MFTKPDMEYMESLHRIVHSNMWPEVEKYLRKELELVKNKLINTTTVADIHILQGRASLLQEFLHQATTTAEVVGKLRNSKSPAYP